jgi:hypothetical protein
MMLYRLLVITNMLEETSTPSPGKIGDSKFCGNVDNHSSNYMVPIIQKITIQSFSAVKFYELLNLSNALKQ